MLYIYNIPARKKISLQLQKVCGFLYINLVGLLFWLQLHFSPILGLVGMAAMWNTLLYYAVLCNLSALVPELP